MAGLPTSTCNTWQRALNDRWSAGRTSPSGCMGLLLKVVFFDNGLGGGYPCSPPLDALEVAKHAWASNAGCQ